MSETVFDAAGRRYNVDPILGRAIAAVESSGRHIDPKTGKPIRSPKGALGMMQLMPGTAAGLGVDPTDETQNIHGGMRYYGQMLDQFGDPVKALQAYNAGPNGNWNNPETRAYVGKVAAEYQRLKAAPVAQAKEDDFSDILNLPTKGAAPAADAAPDNYDDILNLPVRGRDPTVRTNADVLRAAGMGNQELRTATGPVAESLGQPVAADRVPGVGTQAAASMATDPEQKRRIMASRLFPDMPLNEALARVTYDNGRMMAVDMQGRPFYVEPDTFSRGDVPIYQQNWRAVTPGYLAQGAGAALPTAGGIVGGMAAAPTSLVTGPALAAAGAAAGDAVRQGIAGYLDPGRMPYDYAQTLREAALSGAGQLVAAGGARMLAPNPLMVPQSEIRLARTGNVLVDAQQAVDRATAQGVQLTPGQASGLPSLLAYEDVATNNPAFADTARGFYRQQGEQLRGAGNALVNRIAPAADKVDAALQFQQGAEDAIRGVRQQANALARPSYRAAQDAGQVMSPDLAQLADVPAVKGALERARGAYENIYRRPAPETPDFALWDLAKRELDDAHSVAARGGERTKAMAIDSLRGDLRARLDDAYPTYADARAAAEPGQRLASRLEDTAAGKIAGKTGDENARPLVAPMFESTNPAGIKTAREAFEQTGRLDQWNQGVRAYIEDAIDRASTSQEGLNAASLRRKVWSNADVRANLQAAMTPDQFKGFENFLATVEDVAKTMPMNSLTHQRGAASGALAEAAGNTPANKLVRGLGTLLSPQTYFMGARALTDPLDAWITGRNVKSVIGNLFSPNGMQMLEDMARAAPGSNRARAAAIQILSRGTPDLPAANDAKGLSVAPRLNQLPTPIR